MRYLCILAMLALAASGASADLLADNGGPNGVNGLSCMDWPSYPLYREIADDFNVGEPGWYVEDGHFTFVTNSGYSWDFVDQVRVRFYEDEGNRPSEATFAERMADFTAYNTGDYYFSRPEIAVDATFDTVTLTPGKWWVCFQPVMEDNGFWLTSDGLAGDQNVWGRYQDYGDYWQPGSVFFGEDYPGANFQLTGTLIPEPGVVSLAGLLLGAGALWLRRK